MSTAQKKTLQEIDLNKVPPLDHHRTAVTFNCLILKMTDILNSFGNRMEEVMERAELSLDTADRKLRLMEAKLADVKIDEPLATSSEVEKAADDVPGPSTPPVPHLDSEDVAEPPANVILFKDDPTFSKYFKMLKMGVPEAGVIQKMESEGVDSSILRRGDEPSTTQIQKTSGYESSGDSVSSFSDSD